MRKNNSFCIQSILLCFHLTTSCLLATLLLINTNSKWWLWRKAAIHHNFGTNRCILHTLQFACEKFIFYFFLHPPLLKNTVPWLVRLHGLGINQPANQRVASSIPSQGTCLGGGPSPHLGGCEKQPTDVFLAHGCLSLSFSLPYPLKIKKKIKEHRYYHHPCL